MEPGEGDMSPEGMYTRIESGRTEIYAETHFLQGNVHRGKGEDLTNKSLVKEYKVERAGWMSTNRTRG